MQTDAHSHTLTERQQYRQDSKQTHGPDGHTDQTDWQKENLTGQYNDYQYNDIQHSDIQHNNTHYKEIQFDGTQYNGI